MPAKPKKKCCVSRPRCERCPIRMLAEGTLPAGYAVKKRKLVKLKVKDAAKSKAKAKKAKKDKKKDRQREPALPKAA